MNPEEIKWLVEGAGGKVTEGPTALPDGSGFILASFPLPKDHWIYQATGEPPMPFRRGTSDPQRAAWAEKIQEAGRYAIRGSTMSGKEMDFDPDAMLRNLVVGMLGYWTPTGLRGI